jgi:hypothetical protein
VPTAKPLLIINHTPSLDRVPAALLALLLEERTSPVFVLLVFWTTNTPR